MKTSAALHEILSCGARIPWQKKTIIWWTCWWTSASRAPSRSPRPATEASAAGVGVVDLLRGQQGHPPGGRDAGQGRAVRRGGRPSRRNLKIEDDVIAIIPRHVAKKYRVVPVFKTEGKVAVAIADPSDLNTIDSLHAPAERGNRIARGLGAGHRGGAEQILRRREKGHGRRRLQGRHPGTDRSRRAGRRLEDDGAAVEADGPLIRLVNQIIIDAFKLRASDIHLEPLEKRFRLRYRIDGVMQEMKSPPKRLQASIIARLKIQSNMSISEHRIPQDGRIQTKVGTKLIDLRVSCLPTNHGESIVMRILGQGRLEARPARTRIFHRRPADVRAH